MLLGSVVLLAVLVVGIGPWGLSLAGVSRGGTCCGGARGCGDVGFRSGVVPSSAPGAASSVAPGAASSVAPGTAPDTRALEQAALEIYRRQTGDLGPVEVRVTDYGCHVQADIYKNGQKVKSYSYRGGWWQEIR